MKKLNHQTVQEKLKQQGMLLLETYKGINKQHKIQCHCGKIFESKINKVKSCGCLSNKLEVDIDLITNKLKSKGATLINVFSNEKDSQRKYCNINCKCGEEFSIRLDRLYKDKTSFECKKCRTYGKHINTKINNILIKSFNSYKNGISTVNCICHCGKEFTNRLADIKSNKVTSCGCNNKISEQEVISRLENKGLKLLEPYLEKTNSNYQYNIKCKCGKNFKSKLSNILYNQKSCGCELKISGEKRRIVKSYNEITGFYFDSIKRGAQYRNIHFNVNIEYINNLLLKQNKRCALSNIELIIRDYNTIGNASLDRINSHDGYIEGNLQWLDKTINAMKLNMKQIYFIELCEKITQLQTNTLKNFSSYNEQIKIPNKIFSRIKRRSAEKGLEFNISIEYIEKLFYKQSQSCKLSGLKIKFAKNNYELDNGFNTASLDRIDSSKGYTVGNVQWLHKDVNKMKLDHPQEKFIELCKAVAAHNQESTCQTNFQEA